MESSLLISCLNTLPGKLVKQQRGEQSADTIGDKRRVSRVRKERLLRLAARTGAWACVPSTCLPLPNVSALTPCQPRLARPCG